MDAAEPILAAHGLYVSRGGLPILRDVSLRVDRGESVAILGGNGSGKTTLLRAVLGLLPLTEGSIEVFGQPVGRFTDWQRVGYVPQHTTLQVANATVRELVSTGRLARRGLRPWMTKADRDAVAQAIARVGLTERAEWPVGALSGGQRQRAIIARALVSDPEWLIMDEPLAGVDLHSQAGLADLLAILAEQGLTMTVVLHERGPLAALLERYVTLCDGRTVEGEPARHDHHHHLDADAPALLEGML